MNLLDTIILAFRSVRANILRAFLTLSIIAIGITALVGILTSIDGIKASLSSTFSRVGANTYEIKRGGGGPQRSGSRRDRAEPITMEQGEEFKQRFNYPALVSLSVPAAFLAMAKKGDKKTDPNLQIRAIDENYLTVNSLDLAAGRNLTRTEVQSGANFSLIGEGIAKKLFEQVDKAVGQSISVNGKNYRVLGVVANPGSSGFFSVDNNVFISLVNSQIQFPDNNRSYTVAVSVTEAGNLELAISETMGIMRSVRKLPVQAEADFEIVKSDKLASIFFDNIATIVLAATIIGVITLLGAAIGLMNIMLVSVVERTREIGISKALGARNSTILLQFLMEAILIGQLGGLLGIVLGIFVGNGVSLLVEGPFLIPWLWIFMGILFCFIVGVVSGIYPAIKASRLDPIESLRYE